MFAAYGWPVSLSDEEILEKLVALNAERAAEEAQGVIRWLRPEYQTKGAAAPVVTQAALIEEEVIVEVKAEEKKPWPASMAEQAQAVRLALLAAAGAVTPKQVAAGLPALVRRGWRNCWKRWPRWARRAGWKGAGLWGSSNVILDGRHLWLTQ